jgi:hypothetical protein
LFCMPPGKMRVPAPGWTRAPLLGPDGATHDARVALDLAGGAMLVALNSSAAYTSATQGVSGGAWSALKTIVAPQGIVLTTDLASDDAGQATLVYEVIGFSTSQVFAVSGAISNNVWSAPVVLSGSDTSVGSRWRWEISTATARPDWRLQQTTVATM